MSKQPNLVAVYGTLRNNMCANDMMKECTYLGQDFVRGRLFAVATFPGLVIEGFEDEQTVVDVYELPDDADMRAKIMSSLDAYEGYRGPDNKDTNLYNRLETELLNTGTMCQVYEWNEDVDGVPPIPNNDYTNFAFAQTAWGE